MPGHDAGQQRRLQRSVRHELYQFGTRYRTLERDRARGPFGPRPTQRLQLTRHGRLWRLHEAGANFTGALSINQWASQPQLYRRGQALILPDRFFAIVPPLSSSGGSTSARLWSESGAQSLVSARNGDSSDLHVRHQPCTLSPSRFVLRLSAFLRMPHRASGLRRSRGSF